MILDQIIIYCGASYGISRLAFLNGMDHSVCKACVTHKKSQTFKFNILTQHRCKCVGCAVLLLNCKSLRNVDVFGKIESSFVCTLNRMCFVCSRAAHHILVTTMSLCPNTVNLKIIGLSDVHQISHVRTV